MENEHPEHLPDIYKETAKIIEESKDSRKTTLRRNPL